MPRQSLESLIAGLNPKAKMPKGFSLWSTKMMRAWLRQNQQPSLPKRRKMPPVKTLRDPLPDRLFEEWWRKDGVYLDPDSSEVDWYDKRKELAAYAYLAGFAAGKEPPCN